MNAPTMFPMRNRDPDEAAVALFRLLAVPNPIKTKEAGRLICDDVEVCEIRYPGRKDWTPYPSTAFSHWAIDPHTGEQRPVTYAERFPRQYRQFKEHAHQTKSGTPLEYAQFLTEGRKAELRALNIYTVEQLALIEGAELKNLGPNGREMKNAAEAYIAEAKASAPNKAMEAELEQLRARNQVLEEDAKLVAERNEAKKEPAGEFDNMSVEQLRDYITTNTGHEPHGSMPRKTLARMAEGVRQQ